MPVTITFTNTTDVDEPYRPQPASFMIPDWYKNTESYIIGEKKPTGDANTTATIKRCMPVFDALNAGYMLITNTDIYVSQREDENGKKIPWYEWASDNAVQFHPVEQAPVHPDVISTPFPKWINPWSIKTPPGYSTLFVKPFHRELPFSALTGVVDTDTYDAPVNIVFVLSDPNFEGLVPAKTPIVQVIPFQRESWKMEFGKQPELEAQYKTTRKLRTRFFDSYKNQFRQVKEYR